MNYKLNQRTVQKENVADYLRVGDDRPTQCTEQTLSHKGFQMGDDRSTQGDQGPSECCRKWVMANRDPREVNDV